MPWLKIDDGFHDHRKVLRLLERTEDARAALGLWLLAAAWSADNLEDGFVPRFLLRRWGASTAEADALIAAKLWAPAVGREGDEGYQFHDWADYNPLRAEVEAQREYDKRRRALMRDHALLDRVRARDKYRCRYCGSLVNFADRRSSTGGTYDHVDPAGGNNERNVVVACRGCNSAKGGRTPEQWGRRLLPPGNSSGPQQIKQLRAVPSVDGRDQIAQGGRAGRVMGQGSGVGSGPVPELDPELSDLDREQDGSESDLNPATGDLRHAPAKSSEVS